MSAVEELLVAWRASRDPAIADRIDALSRGTALPGKTQAVRVAAWTALAEKGERIPDLLATPWPKTIAVLAPMVRLLAALPDDPRIAMAFARLLPLVPLWQGDETLALVAKRLAELRDARTLPVLVANLSRNEMANVSREPLEVLRALPRYVPPDGSALLAAIYADPDDLGARQVYADWLTERGDPRGDFMTRQLAGAPVPAAVLEQHAMQWAEPIGGHFHSWHYEHGFFAGGSMSTLPTSFEHPAWQLVRVLRTSEPQAVLAQLPRLRRMDVVNAVELTGNLEELAVISGWEMRLPSFAGLPKLRSLALSQAQTYDLHWYRDAPVIARLRHLAVSGGRRTPEVVAVLAETGGALRELEVATYAFPLYEAPGWHLSLRREAAPAAWSALHVRWVGGGVRQYVMPLFADLVGRIPATLREIVVEGRVPKLAPDEIAAIDAAIARHPGARVTVPWRR